MSTVIVTSPEALDQTISRQVEAALKAHLPEAVRRATQKPYLTKPELMELTGWSSRSVEYKKSTGQLSFVRRGRLVLFPTQEVYEYLDAGYVPATRTGKPKS